MEEPMSKVLRSLSGKGWWLLAIVVGLAAGLALALVAHRGGKLPSVAQVVSEHATPTDLHREVDAVCMAFAIGREDIRVRQEESGSGEHRIVVDDAFRSLEFNYALNRRLARWGVRVVGEERPREKKVAFRLMSEDKQVWSILLLIQKTARKEDRHRP
jgi:hypothetical protein